MVTTSKKPIVNTQMILKKEYKETTKESNQTIKEERKYKNS